MLMQGQHFQVQLTSALWTKGIGDIAPAATRVFIVGPFVCNQAGVFMEQSIFME